MIKDLWSGEKYTTEQLNARLKFFIGIVLGLTLFGIVFVILYSLIFVTQPMNGISPVDNKFFELIIPIATFLTGTLSGIMLAGDDKDLRAKAIDAANKPYTPPPSTTPSSSGLGASVSYSTGSFGAQAAFSAAPSFGAQAAFSAAPSFGDESENNFPGAVSLGFGGKEAPDQPKHPEL